MATIDAVWTELQEWLVVHEVFFSEDSTVKLSPEEKHWWEGLNLE